MPRTVMPTPDRPHPPRTHATLAAHLPALRANLEEHRRFRLDQIAQIIAEDQHTRADHRPTDPVDTSADTARSQVRAALWTAARHALADIDAALERIRTGQYGICLDCQRQIPLQRLRIAAQTRYCVTCQHRAASRR